MDLPKFCKKHGICSLAVFGSYSRGQQTQESDLDLLVQFSKPVSLLKHVEVQQELEVALGVKVDLLTPQGLHSKIKSRVLASQKVIYEEAG